MLLLSNSQWYNSHILDFITSGAQWSPSSLFHGDRFLDYGLREYCWAKRTPGVTILFNKWQAPSPFLMAIWSESSCQRLLNSSLHLRLSSKPFPILDRSGLQQQNSHIIMKQCSHSFMQWVTHEFSFSILGQCSCKFLKAFHKQIISPYCTCRYKETHKNCP